MKILVPVSLGELYDKISILRIKEGRIEDNNKLLNIKKELELLLKIAEEHPIDHYYYYDLFNINSSLWGVEDNLRELEKQELFDDSFINFARRVYVLNDKRSKIKKEINEKYSSDIIEEKSYTKYK